MSKIEALINYLEIDSEEIEIIQNGNYFEIDDIEYNILTLDEVYELGEEQIRESLKQTLYEEVPEYLHEYFNENKYVDDNIDGAFDYVDYGYGYEEIEDDNGNKYYCFRI